MLHIVATLRISTSHNAFIIKLRFRFDCDVHAVTSTTNIFVSWISTMISDITRTKYQKYIFFCFSKNLKYF